MILLKRIRLTVRNADSTTYSVKLYRNIAEGRGTAFDVTPNSPVVAMTNRTLIRSDRFSMIKCSPKKTAW